MYPRMANCVTLLTPSTGPVSWLHSHAASRGLKGKRLREHARLNRPVVLSHGCIKSIPVRAVPWYLGPIEIGV